MKSPSALSVARELQQAGVRLRVYACDVSDFEQLEQTLALFANEMPPIRGVIQSVSDGLESKSPAECTLVSDPSGALLQSNREREREPRLISNRIPSPTT